MLWLLYLNRAVTALTVYEVCSVFVDRACRFQVADGLINGFNLIYQFTAAN